MSAPKPIPSVFLNDTHHRQILEQRVTERIVKHGDDGCWEWQWSTQHHGHAVIARNIAGVKVTVMVHRLTYAWEYGDPPLPLDHLCGNPPCVNPRHLQPVSIAENNRRSESIPAQNARKTHCQYGHPLYGDNLYVEPSGKRRCKACMARRQQKWYEKQDRKTPARKGKRRTHCKNGHPATPKNTYYRKNGAAECRVCHRIREGRRQRKD